MSGDTSAEQLAAFLAACTIEQVRLDRVTGMSPVEVHMVGRVRG